MARIVQGTESSFTTVTGDVFWTGLFGVNNAAGLVTVSGYTLSINSETHDVTPLNAINMKSLSGLRSYNASVAGFGYAIPRLGNAGIVTMANPTFYTTNARAWTLSIEPYAVHDVTSFHATTPGSGPTWRSFMPDLGFRWSGTYTCGIDDTTIVRTGGSGTEPIQAPSITDDTASTDLSNITLIYGDSSTDESFTGEVQVTGYPVVARRGEKLEATFSFVGSGPLTAAGTNCLFTGSRISTGNVLGPVWGGNGSAPLVARFYEKASSTTRYYETADMFDRRFTIGAEVGRPIAYSMDLVGSGVLTSN